MTLSHNVRAGKLILGPPKEQQMFQTIKPEARRETSKKKRQSPLYKSFQVLMGKNLGNQEVSNLSKHMNTPPSSHQSSPF